ncbi:type IV pilin protein [Candidatus Avelusimicrobium caledoniensis]|uniref:type IV pilin protein n=1 Tax=Candidatus Avelusimicrobium caledoniensis TaxID=3416220 RepID=UPI003D0C352D
MKNKQAFTLIELLVVVLIIGILAAVALPQYQKAVEKSRMSEAMALLRTIADAHQVFFLTNGRYATHAEMDLLDIEIPGETTSGTHGRPQTNYFSYSPNISYSQAHPNADYLAVAQRLPFNKKYYLYISQAEPHRIGCEVKPEATATQRVLCEQLNRNGSF